MTKIDKLLEVTKENNKMLKQIVAYINYINKNHANENEQDFMMNVIANVISNKFPFNKF